MAQSSTDQIQDARKAFRAGDIARGGKLLHQVLLEDIRSDEAWRLLFDYLAKKGESFSEFRLRFAEKYYPNQLDRLEEVLPPAAPYRRVSLIAEEKPQQDPGESGVLDFPRPKTGPLPEPRQVKQEAAPRRISFLGRLFSRKRKDPETSGATERKRTPGPLRRWVAGFRPVGRKTDGPEQAADIPAKKAPEVQPSKSEEDVEPGIRSIESGISLLGLNKIRPGPENIPTERPAGKTSEASASLARGLGERRGIRVLIADDIDHTREMIRKLLIFEPSVDVVGVAASGVEAVERAAELQPDIVLLDINMPDMDGLQALRIIRTEQPVTQVVMLTVQDDPGYLREALQAGARDYLIKPPMIDDLLQAIHNAYGASRAASARLDQLARQKDPVVESGSPSGPGQVVSVFSPKGGVGCTLIASNLAAALRKEDVSVLLLDGDFQFGTVGQFFNEAGRNKVADLARAMDEMDRNIVREAIVRHPETGVDLLLAHRRFELSGKAAGSRVTDLLKLLRSMYGYVIVDTPSTVDDVTLSVMETSDQVLLVCTQDIPAINDMRKMLDLAPRAGIHPDKVSLVLNQYHNRVKITPEQIASNLRIAFSGVIPLDNQTVVPSINRGVPFISDPAMHSRPVAKAILELEAQVVLAGRSTRAG